MSCQRDRYFQVVFNQAPVRFVAAGRFSLLIHIQSPGIERQSIVLQNYPDIAAPGDFQGMAGDAEAGDIGAGMQVKLKGRLHGRTVQGCQRGQCVTLQIMEGKFARAHRIEKDAGAQRLGKDQGKLNSS